MENMLSALDARKLWKASIKAGVTAIVGSTFAVCCIALILSAFAQHPVSSDVLFLLEGAGAFVALTMSSSLAKTKWLAREGWIIILATSVVMPTALFADQSLKMMLEHSASGLFGIYFVVWCLTTVALYRWKEFFF